MECQTLACYHEFSRKLIEVIPEKPKFCLKIPRVTGTKVRTTVYQSYNFSQNYNIPVGCTNKRAPPL